jgi:hypothetical protein
MISLIDSKLLSLESAAEIKNNLYFRGQILDQRGHDLVGTLDKDNSCIEVIFDVNTYIFTINKVQVGIRDLARHLSELINEYNFSNILLEATTLGFVEILVLLKWFSKSEFDNLQIVYAEPRQYSLRTNYMNDFGKHEFDLSTHSGGFKAIPGFAKALTQTKKAILIASMGFERSRLGQLLSLDDGAYIQSVIPIYGTPGFKAGWDKHSFFQNVETLKDKGQKPRFVSANSPIDMLAMLNYIATSYTDEEITLAPLGTKPLSIASAIFLINNPNITLKYDHPQKKGKRSDGIGEVHLYTITRALLKT